MVDQKPAKPAKRTKPNANLGTPARPWIVSSAEKAADLPDGAWYVIAPEGGAAPTGPARRKTS